MSYSKPFIKLDIPTEEDTELTFNDKKTLKGHRDRIDSILHFDSPIDKLVSCSWDKSIRIWCSKSYKCLDIIEDPIYSVNEMMKLNPEVFISGSDDRTIRSFSISSHEQLKEMKLDSLIYGLLKLTEDRFLCYSGMSIYVISYPSFEIVKKYEKLRLYYTDNSFLLSLNYPNCFFASTNTVNESIILIDFEKDRIVKEFTGHDPNKRTRAICLFTNSRNEEILIVFQTQENICSYNTAHPKFDTNKEIEQEEGGLLHDYSISCCCCLNNQFVFCGNDEGSVSIYQFIEQESGLRRIGTKEIISTEGIRSVKNTVRHITIVDSIGNPSIRLFTSTLTSSHGGEIRIIQVNGLHLKGWKSFEILDLKERIHFLFHEPEKIFFDEKKENMVEIKMANIKMVGVSKLFL